MGVTNIYCSISVYLDKYGAFGEAVINVIYCLTAVLMIFTSISAFYALKRKSKVMHSTSYESMVRGSIAAHQTANMLKNMPKHGNPELKFSLDQLLNQELYSKSFSLFSCCESTSIRKGNRIALCKLKRMIFDFKINERKCRFFYRIMCIDKVNRSILNDHIRKYGLLPHTISEQLAYRTQVEAMKALNEDMMLISTVYHKRLEALTQAEERIRGYINGENFSPADIMTVEDECVDALSAYERRLGDFFGNNKTVPQQELFNPADAEYEQKLTESIRGDIERAFLLAAIAFYDLEQTKIDLLSVSENCAKAETLYLKALHRAEEARSYAVSIGEINASDVPGRHAADRIARIVKPRYNYVTGYNIKTS